MNAMKKNKAIRKERIIKHYITPPSTMPLSSFMDTYTCHFCFVL